MIALAAAAALWSLPVGISELHAPYARAAPVRPSYDLGTVPRNEPRHARRATGRRIVNAPAAKTFTPAWLPDAAFGVAVVVLVLFALALLRSGTAGEPRGS